MSIGIGRIKFKGREDLAKFCDYFQQAKGAAPGQLYISKKQDEEIRRQIKKTLSTPLSRLKKVTGSYMYRGISVEVH